MKPEAKNVSIKEMAALFKIFLLTIASKNWNLSLGRGSLFKSIDDLLKIRARGATNNINEKLMKSNTMSELELSRKFSDSYP